MFLFTALVLPLTTSATTLSADIEHSTDAQTGLKAWKLTKGHFHLELVQRLPDQTRAFFLGRGFDKDNANMLGTDGCVFQAIMKNTAAKSADSLIDIDLKQWRMKQINKPETGIRLSSDWLKHWQERGLTQSSQIAFKWSFFPTVQHFQGGDYNWGMTSYGLQPGETFDLTVVWKENGQPNHETISGIECAPDR